MESQGIIHKVCTVYTRGEEQRKDLFQEILIQLWRSYPSFRGDAKFTTWMYRISLNVALQQVRKRKKSLQKVEISTRILELPEAIQSNEFDGAEIKLLYKAIDQLNDVEKGIVLLYLEEEENEEIARIMGITPNYVRVKLHRIKAKLKKILNPQ